MCSCLWYFDNRRYPLSHRAVTNDLPLGDNETGVAEILKMEGYDTGYIGKWHLDGLPRDKFTPPGKRRFGFDKPEARYYMNL